GWGNVSVASAPRHPKYEGRSIADLAAAAGADPVDLVAELLIAEEAAVTIVHKSMSLEDNRATLAWSHTMVGSDGIPTPGKPHPRWAGSFVRMLGRYGRAERLVGMTDAVRKMTSLPAARFRLEGRGVLREGAAADVAVFDPVTVTDRATYTEPLLPPAGVRHVVVGGMAVVLDGEPTGAAPGRVLLAE
ncbi:MAG: amidohydrolase family protein, partial [Acidimicrobiia bacterium]